MKKTKHYCAQCQSSVLDWRKHTQTKMHKEQSNTSKKNEVNARMNKIKPERYYNPTTLVMIGKKVVIGIKNNDKNFVGFMTGVFDVGPLTINANGRVIKTFYLNDAATVKKFKSLFDSLEYALLRKHDNGRYKEYFR